MGWKLGVLIASAAWTLVACRQGESVDIDVRQDESPMQNAWSPAPFNDTDKNIRDNNIKQFFDSFQKSVESSTKKEFETTEQYKARISDANITLSPISTNEIYLFIPDSSDLEYDADSGSYKAQSPVWCYSSYPIDRGISCKFGEIVDSSRIYAGTNSFGASAEVTERRGRDVYFVFDRKTARLFRSSRNKGDMRLPVRCPVPMERAKTLGPVGAAYAIKVTKPELISGSSQIEAATVASPQDNYFETYGIPAKLIKSVCFAKQTGEILHIASISDS